MLVAEHDDDGVIGVIVAYPPLAVIRQFVQQSGRLGVDPLHVVLNGGLGIVRIRRWP